MEKKCKGPCGEILEIWMFAKDASHKDGLQSYCRMCKREAEKKYTETRIAYMRGDKRITLNLEVQRFDTAELAMARPSSGGRLGLIKPRHSERVRNSTNRDGQRQNDRRPDLQVR